MKLKVPPALVAFVIGLVMWGFDHSIHPAFAIFTVPQWPYRLILGVAVTVGVLALYQFFQNRTTVDPHKPGHASKLVTGGIYRFSRNPMYVALLILMIGFGFKLGNLFSLLLLPLFVMYMNRFQITPEEEILREKFGVEFENYTSQVRRWL
jgi:protein-S-isoprenylcysteine O-methyltransferase Ste14